MGRPKGSTSKMGMVRTSLEELGKDAKPMAIQEHIQAKHGVEIPKIIISNYKSTILKKKGGGRKKRGRPVGSKSAIAPVATGATSSSKGLRMEDIAAVSGLVGRLGAAQVRQLVDVLA